jgi:PBSX family phage terminase large subunit
MAEMSKKQTHSIVHATDYPITLWAGAVSSGKTIASLFAFLFAVRNAQGTGLIVIVGKTLQTIERNLLDPLMSYKLFGPLSRGVKHTKGSGTAVIFGRTVDLVGANDIRAEEKIRGSTVEIGYVDEATLLPYGFWDMFVSRFRTENDGYLLATTNPGSTRHWLRQEWVLKAEDKGMQVFHFLMDDNPVLKPEYVDRMKASFAGVFYDRMINGNWTNAEGAVFDSWEPDKHIVQHGKLPSMQRILGLGIDYGTTNATSAIMLGIGDDNKLYAIDEWRHDARAGQESLTNSKIATGILTWMDQVSLPDGSRPLPEWLIIDPSAASLKNEFFDRGITNYMDAVNDVLYGIQTVASVLQDGRLFISDRCKGLIGEMSEYRWDAKAAERGEDKPMKEADHSVDALRYAVTSTETNWRYVLRRAA